MELKERVLGCMVGGACGDALGYGVEFLRLREIKEKYGRDGITELLESPANADVAFYCKRPALWIYDGY